MSARASTAAISSGRSSVASMSASSVMDRSSACTTSPGPPWFAGRSARWASAAASRLWARLVRDFTVPTGMPSCCAICSWVSPEQVRPAHDLAFVGREPVERPPDLVALPQRLHGHAVDLHVDLGRMAATRGLRLGPQRIDRRVPGDRVEPGRELTVALERVARPPCLQERLLHDIGRELAVADDRHRDRHHRTGVLAVELADRVGVAGAEALDHICGGHATVMLARGPAAPVPTSPMRARQRHCFGAKYFGSGATSSTAPPASFQPLNPTVRWATLV